MADLQRINNTLGKMNYYLATHNSICVSVSGGSDSDLIVHIIARYFRQYLEKIHFVFCNTGLEYRATLRHLDELEEKYNISIDRIRGKSVVSVVKQDGIPIISKDYSNVVGGAVKGRAFGLKRIERTRQESKFAMSANQKALAHYLINNKIKISCSCCNKSKKNPLHKYEKQHKADLIITGERKAEGGQRAQAHKDCFESKNGKTDRYMPLWFWDNETKQYYKEHEHIQFSDCYEVWGMKRTGCVGCPFNSHIGEDLKMIKQYEPNLYRACMNVFGESYKLMDEFNIRRLKILSEEEREDNE